MAGHNENHKRSRAPGTQKREWENTLDEKLEGETKNGETDTDSTGSYGSKGNEKEDNLISIDGARESGDTSNQEAKVS